MKKIGFIDYFLKEWHADNYPKWIKEASNGEMEVCYGYGLIDEPNGLDTNKQWCEKMGIELISSIEQLVDKSDYIIVLSPNDAQMHKQLSEIPLKSQKPTFIDKTFAETLVDAEYMFNLAQKYNTPMYSSSALRFCDEHSLINKNKIDSIVSFGGGVIEKYLVHQVEQIVKLIGTDVKEVKNIGTKLNPAINIKFYSGKNAIINMCENAGFSLNVLYNDKTMEKFDINSNFFNNAMIDMVNFFKTGISSFPKEETLAAIKIIQAAVDEYKNL